MAIGFTSELFVRGKKDKDKEEGQAKEAELFQQIGKLQMGLESGSENLSCSDARELRKLVDPKHPELSISRQCAPLGLPRSTYYYRSTPVWELTLQITARIDALYLEDPRSGSRRMVEYQARKGIPISRDRMRNLMRGQSLTCDSPESPHHHAKRAIRTISLPGGPQATAQPDHKPTVRMHCADRSRA